MKLYVSDLDGTLLNDNQEISEYSTTELNKLINSNVNITVATARSPATAVDILEKVDLKIPVTLMNGVLIYDIKKKEYIDVKEIDNNTVEKALEIFKENNKHPLVYGIKDNHLRVFHGDFENDSEKKFYNERKDKPLKTFVKVDDYFEAIKGSRIINFITFDKKEVVLKIYDKLKELDGLTINHYDDIYSNGYFLEAYSKDASKANGIIYLAKYVNHSKLITFGDNVNDIPMFEISDDCYAMDNGAEVLKEMATEVIGNNNDDWVVKKIRELEGL